MSRIRASDTKPEMVVRRLVHGMGYRYRLHVADLPGSPDLVFRRRKKVIFVHGCFWHQHRRCNHYRQPKHKLDFWGPKLASNVKRDKANQRALRRAGWSYLVIWECQIRDTDGLKRRIRDFLETEK